MKILEKKEGEIHERFETNDVQYLNEPYAKFDD